MSSLVQHPMEQEYGYTMRSVRRTFSEQFPTTIGALIGLLQMFLNGAIVGLEGASAAYDPFYDIIYAGFWCSFSFFFSWLAMVAFLCFRKTIRWGLVVAGINLISMGFAVILIVFDSLFIQNPGQCYLATACYSNSAIVYNSTNADGKSRIVTAQLAMVATMLASNIIYVIIFIVVAISTRVTYKPLRPSFQQIPSPYNSSPRVNYPIQTPGYAPPPPQLTYTSRYRQPIYPEHTGQWGPSSPYFNRIEKF